jgi:hypothetical protein
MFMIPTYSLMMADYLKYVVVFAVLNWFFIVKTTRCDRLILMEFLII